MDNLIKIICLALLLPLGTNAGIGHLRVKDKRKKSKTNHDSLSSSLESGRMQWNGDRPTMHTFFHRIGEENHRTTGMTDDQDFQLIAAWEDAWQAAGWNTRVIGMKEAMEHPDFEYYVDQLVGFKKKKGEKLIGYYDKLCFLRWLAMAQVGGGWMSDYDTFPMRQKPIYQLPNDGRLTMYDKMAGGSAVPSLVSGSKEAYYNIAHRFLGVISNRVNTDMYALMHLTTEYFTEMRVMKGRNAIELWKESNGDCDVVLSETWAIHFSHANMNKARRAGNLPATAKVGDRGLYAPMIIKDLSERCNLKKK